MKRKIVPAIIGIVSAFCVLIPTFGAITIWDRDRPSTSADVSENTDIVTVRFYQGSSQVGIKYVPKGDEIRLSDAPFTFQNGLVYTWQSESDGTYINNHPAINQDTVFNAVQVSGSYNRQLLDTYWDEYGSSYAEQKNPKANTDISKYSSKENGASTSESALAGVENDLYLDETCYWLSTTETNFYIKCDNGNSNPDNLYYGINVYDQYNPYSVAQRDGTYDIGDNVSYVRAKGSIGLETFQADFASDTYRYNEYYKPVNYDNFDSSGYSPLGTDTTFFKSASERNIVPARHISEYCAHRITLHCDVVLTGKINLGGNTGFIKTNGADGEDVNWTQASYQGLMVGAYSEIDLNGYDLILENGAYIDSYGSITDSDPDRGGNLIVRSGSSASTPFVFENAYREETIPEAFFDGTDFMPLFRCPYLDCNLIVEPGGMFYGNMFVSFGKNSSFNTKINIIGSSADFMFQIISQDGYVSRKTFYNLDLYNKIKNHPSNAGQKWMADVSLYNITYQKFKYSFANVQVNVNPLKIDMDMKFNALISASFGFSSEKYHKVIPPYFDFYSYNSTINIKNTYLFMDGCYLFGDESSIINFGYGQYDSGKCDLDEGKNQKNYYSGGLNLSTDYYSFLNGTKGSGYWYDDRKKGDGGNQSYSTLPWSWTKFWDYYAEKPAKMDFFGTFNFDSNSPIPYSLGGIINLKDNNVFLNSVSSLRNEGKLNLYASSVISAITMSYVTQLIGIIGGFFDASQRRTFSAAGYYNAPLISNGEVLTDVGYEGNGILTYDIKRRLVIDPLGKTYAFMFIDDGPANHINFANYTSYYSDKQHDSLSGEWREVTIQYDTDVSGLPSDSSGMEYINYGGNDYINFQGAFLRYNPLSNGISLMKLVGQCGMTSNNKNDNLDTTNRDVFRSIAYGSSSRPLKVTSTSVGSF